MDQLINILPHFVLKPRADLIKGDYSEAKVVFGYKNNYMLEAASDLVVGVTAKFLVSSHLISE